MFTAQYFPSNIQGFILVEAEVEAVMQCSLDSLEWSRVFIVHFCLCNKFEHSYITVPYFNTNLSTVYCS